MDGFVALIGWAFGISLYLLPTGLAVRQRKRNAGVIFVVNLVFGWTVVGWVIALVWAIRFDRAEPLQLPLVAEPAIGPVPSSVAGEPEPGQRVQLLLDTVAREDPDPAAAVRVALTKGIEVTVIHTHGNWAWVQTDSGEEGWVAF